MRKALLPLLILAATLAGCATPPSHYAVHVIEAQDLHHVLVRFTNHGNTSIYIGPSDFTLVDARGRSFEADFLKSGTAFEDGKFPTMTVPPATYTEGFLSFNVDEIHGPFMLHVKPMGLLAEQQVRFTLSGDTSNGSSTDEAGTSAMPTSGTAQIGEWYIGRHADILIKQEPDGTNATTDWERNASAWYIGIRFHDPRPPFTVRIDTREAVLEIDTDMADGEGVFGRTLHISKYSQQRFYATIRGHDAAAERVWWDVPPTPEDSPSRVTS